MKKIDLGQTISILANIGVIAGILFLAIELQQNNELLRAEAGNNLLGNRLADRSVLLDQADFAGLLLKLASDQPLGPSEDMAKNAYIDSLLLRWQWEFNEYRQGRITEEDLPIDAWRRILEGHGPFNIRRDVWLERWSEFKPFLTSEYTQWMEERVVNLR